MRRKFGQRVWCHVQVVDPSMEAVAIPQSDADLEATAAEIELKKDLLAAKEEDKADDDGGEASSAKRAGEGAFLSQYNGDKMEVRGGTMTIYNKNSGDAVAIVTNLSAPAFTGLFPRGHVEMLLDNDA